MQPKLGRAIKNALATEPGRFMQPSFRSASETTK